MLKTICTDAGRRWRLSRNESATTNFSKDEPDPSPQILKLFAEEFIVTRKRGLPSQKTACHNFTSFTSKWERETSRTLPRQVKDDVLNVRPLQEGYFVAIIWTLINS
jgi:hypothetical protein